MAADKIFMELSGHMLKGLMFHEEMANYFAFLCLEGYSCCHEWHYREESKNYRDLTRYYITHFNKLIPKHEGLRAPQIIPTNWYGYERKAVDITVKRNVIKDAIQSWIDWEKETKELYEKKYKELCDSNDVAAAQFISQFIEDVDYELKDAETKMLNLSATGFDMPYIIGEQEELIKKYPC